MATLDREQIRHLATLCRIQCTEDDEESLLNDLRRIVDLADQIQEVDTENVQPCNSVLAGMTNVFREDDIGETLPRETFLNNAPEHVGGMVRVPPVIRKGDHS